MRKCEKSDKKVKTKTFPFFFVFPPNHVKNNKKSPEFPSLDGVFDQFSVMFLFFDPETGNFGGKLFLLTFGIFDFFKNRTKKEKQTKL